MITIDELFSLSTQDFLFKARNASLEDRVFIWEELQRRLLLDPNNVCFERYLIPLLSPCINKYKAYLPTYGTYREDFEQEIRIDIFTHLASYHPYHNGQRLLGSVYFGNRIRGVYTRIIREIQENYCISPLLMQFEDGGEEEYLVDKKTQDMTDVAIRERALKEYQELCEKYSEYYARRKTKEALENQKFI